MHIPGLVIKRGILMLTKEEFQQKIQEGVHILDGATGSNLRAAGMPKDCCTEQWVLENPEPLVALQRAYAAAGSQIIYAPTFQAQPIALKTVGMDAQTEKINEALVALSRSAAPGCLIAGDLTTLAVYCESWNPDCFDLLVENYRRQIRGLIDGGADLLIGETLLYAQEAEAILTAAELEGAGAAMYTFTMQSDGALFSGADGGKVLRDLEAAGGARRWLQLRGGGRADTPSGVKASPQCEDSPDLQAQCRHPHHQRPGRRGIRPDTGRIRRNHASVPGQRCRIAGRLLWHDPGVHRSSYEIAIDLVRFPLHFRFPSPEILKFFQKAGVSPAFLIAKPGEVCYNYIVMKNRIHLYVSRKNALTWLMALCMVCSAVARIALSGLKGSGDAHFVWSQIVLPIAAALLYALIALLSGKEQFYKTAIPVWLMAWYAGMTFSAGVSSRLMAFLFWVAVIFFAFLYTDITAGRRKHAVLLLFPILCCPLLFLMYCYRAFLLQHDYYAGGKCLPDFLMVLGMLILLFGIRVHPVDEYHPTWGDRTDGRRLRTLPPMAQVSPYIMVTRNTSTNFFEESLEISHIDRYIRRKRREGLTSFGITHVLLAAYCRGVCRYPGLNRFLAGQKVYTHGDDIQYCMTVKKEMTADSPDTIVKVHLNPHDTADDVYRKLQSAVENVKNTPLDSSFDNTAGALTLIPGVFLKFTVWLLKTLDYFGMLPKFLLEVSPFHGSLFFTSMGSLGIPPIYHHLYDFGNLPVFGAFGMKRRAVEVQEDGSVVEKKYVDIKFTMDERIVDGFYYAAFFKHYRRILAHPEILDNPPEEVLSDID